MLKLFIIFALATTDFGIYCLSEDIKLSFGNFTIFDEEVVDEEKILYPNSEFKINIIDVPDEVSFVIVQLHSYLHNLTLSYNEVLNSKNHVTGLNIGLPYFFENYHSTATFFLKNVNSVNVSVLLVVVPYKDTSPVPGGCNLVLPTPVAPYLQLKENDAIIAVDGTPAALSDQLYDCDINSLSYVMFYKYSNEWDFSSENYFESIRSMLTYPRILKSAYMAKGPLLRRYFSKYLGTGATYALVVFNQLGSAAVYTPIHTFGCENDNYESCESLSISYTRTYISLIIGFNLFLCFAGHRFFLFEMFFIPSEVGFLLTFITLLQQTSYTDDLLVMSVAIGSVIGIVWLGLWWCLNSPLLMILLPFFLSNLIIFSTIHYFFLGNMAIFQSDINFWLMLLGLTLIATVISVTAPVFFNMISCAVIGAYGSVIPIDYYLGSNLKYIIINLIRRSTIENFNLANTKPPFEIRDFLILFLWCFLIHQGYKCQKRLSTNRPPFPPKCYLLRQHTTEGTPFMTPNSSYTS